MMNKSKGKYGSTTVCSSYSFFRVGRISRIHGVQLEIRDHCVLGAHSSVQIVGQKHLVNVVLGFEVEFIF